MNKIKTNYYLDIILTLLFIVVAVTGFVMYFAIPPGVPRGRYQEFLGLTKASWTLIHNRSAILMTAVVGLHLILHKKWICCVTRNIFNSNSSEKCELSQQE